MHFPAVYDEFKLHKQALEAAKEARNGNSYSLVTVLIILILKVFRNVAFTQLIYSTKKRTESTIRNDQQ